MSARSERAGRYVLQPGGYHAFLPKPLPPDPPLTIDEHLQDLLSSADLALGRLDGAVHTLPHPDFFVLMYVRKEAVLSSQIEGAQSSLQDLLAAEARILDPDRPGDVKEVLNYVAALRLGLEMLDRLPVSGRLLRMIHERLLRGVRGRQRSPGTFRTVQNWIGSEGASIREATFVPPPPSHLLEAIAHLERFLNTEVRMPLLIRTGLAHAQFETIHPFLDGNGRLGRLLITFLLCAGGALRQPVLYLSHYFKRHRTEYYARLQRIRDEGDWEGWMTFFLNGVRSVAEEATETTRRIVELRERHRRVILERFGRRTASALSLLERLYGSPVVSVKQVMEITGTSFQAANTLVERFVEEGVLSEFTGRTRNRRFRYAAYIDLFAADT